MRRLLLTVALLLAPVVANAQTGGQSISVRDVIALSKAGLGEEALIALIDVNRTVFPIDVDTLKALKNAGVTQNVIVAMIRSGRTPPPEPLPESMEPLPPATAAEAPPVVVVEHHHEEPVIREVAVPIPVYVAVPVRRIDRGHLSHPRIDKPSKKVEPVFWGWGGKLRPDAWKPAIEIQKDAKVPLHPQRK